MITAGPFAGRRLHFVGIGGAGMSGLALLAAQLGAEVSGSDRAESPYMAELRAAGIEPAIGHDAAHVPDAGEIVRSTAVPPDNPELAAARDRGLGELHRSELMAQLAALKRCIAVSGTHGKTTTSAMIVCALRGAGMDPAYLVGGELRETGANAGWGTGEWIVVEADESDRSLLALAPEIAVLTNAELDHHTTYGSRLDLEATLREFLTGPAHAVIWDRPELLALRDGNAVAFEVADPAAAAAALTGFRGTARRFEEVGRTAAGALVYDDYAHHPTEVAATISAARTLGPRRVVAAFQPHLYSRTAALWREFGAALAAADVAVVTDVYRARERAEEHPGISGRLIAQAAADAGRGRPVAWMPTLGQAERFLAAELRKGDLLLTMGAGDVDALARAVVA